jgi:hypothetical protein
MPDETVTPTADALPDVIVNVEPDTATDAVVVTDPAKDLAAQYEALQEKSKEDKAARDAADARAAEAERRAAQAQRDAQAAREAATSSSLDTITTALASAQSALDAAKKDKRTAREAGDFEAESDADDRMIQARIDLRTYDEAKSSLEARKAAPRTEAPSDPVEAFVRGRSEPTAKWAREHREFITDPIKNKKLTAAHFDAEASGYAPDTPQYFDHVEKFIGLKKDAAVVTEGDDVQRPGAAKEAAKEAKKQAQRSVAPVNGSAGSGGAVSGNTVTLTSREAAAATDGTVVWNWDDTSGNKKFKKGDPVGVEEFARRKQKMVQQGLYDKTYDNQ